MNVRSQSMERIRQLNPVLPDIIVSQLVMFAVGEIVILLCAPYKMALALGYAAGIIYVIFSVVNITLVLDKAVYYEERGAMARTLGGYFLRIFVLGIVEVILYQAGGLPSVFMSLAAMATMKVSAYLQPFTHKIIKKLNKKGG